MTDQLEGVHIVVPRSRAGRNVLADALRTKSATVVEIPDLGVAPPSDPRALDAAVARASHFAWLIFSGAHSVKHFFERPGALELARSGALDGRLVALGTGTVGALKERGIAPTLAPTVHRPSAVLDGLGPIAGAGVLLVREESAENDLPDALRRAGAEVTNGAGYRLAIHLDASRREEILATRPDLVALQNPTAARILRQTLDAESAAWEGMLEGVPVAVVGPSTAEAAKRYGFPPGLVAGGRLASLIAEIVARWGVPGR